MASWSSTTSNPTAPNTATAFSPFFSVPSGLAPLVQGLTLTDLPYVGQFFGPVLRWSVAMENRQREMCQRR